MDQEKEAYKFDLCIIDCDPLVYRCGFAVETVDKVTDIVHLEPIEHAYYNVNSMIKKTINRCGTANIKGFLTSSDKSNFRFTLFDQYKANRKDARKPFYYDELRSYLSNRYKATMIFDQEADDACSIVQCQANPFGFELENRNSIVCSFDKDFNNIPGWHYNYVTDEIYYITEIQALKNFYLQILTGDTSDGIPRIKKGWRQKTTEEALNKATNEKEMLAIVYNTIYNIWYDTDTEYTKEQLKQMELDTMAEIVDKGRLVWLRRKENEMWLPLGGEEHAKEKVS